MDPKKVFRFCPRCGGALIAQEESLRCASCNNDLYINPVPCNGVIIENEKKEILLVKRKFDPFKGMWDLPGGFVRSGESFADSISREIREELGVEIEITGIVGVYEDTYIFQELSNQTFAVIATAKIVKGILSASDDVEKFMYFGRDVVLKQEIAFPGLRRALEDYLK
jgi:ADP-ribose pyrophosphatase YjhB (NUDIX family)